MSPLRRRMIVSDSPTPPSGAARRRDASAVWQKRRTGSARDERARTTGRKSAPAERVEVITRGERRRAWTPEQKREIVTESLAPGVTAAEVARKHGISTGLLYTWRQQLLAGPTAVITRAEPRFAEVELTAALPALEPGPTPVTAASPTPSPRPEGLIEIMLPGGALVRVDAQVDGPALRRVLSALQER
jgi:transposase